MCCITAWHLPAVNKPTLDWTWSSTIPHLRYCPLFGVNDDGKPTCLIYEERPKICRDFVCDREAMIKYVKHFKYNIALTVTRRDTL